MIEIIQLLDLISLSLFDHFPSKIQQTQISPIYILEAAIDKGIASPSIIKNIELEKFI